MCVIVKSSLNGGPVEMVFSSGCYKQEVLVTSHFYKKQLIKSFENQIFLIGSCFALFARHKLQINIFL